LIKIGLQGLVKLGELRPQNLIEEPFGCANHDRVAPLPLIAIGLHAITPAQGEKQVARPLIRHQEPHLN
jgi:hypothetical protein